MAPQIRFNYLNKPVSAHPSLYGTQVRPYLFTSLSEGPRPPSVLPMRSRDPCLALRCFRTCGKAPVQPTASFTGERRFLARGAFACLGFTPLAGLIGAKLPRDTLFKVAVCHAKISTNYGVLLYPISGGVARHAWLGPRTAAQAKLTNLN